VVITKFKRMNHWMPKLRPTNVSLNLPAHLGARSFFALLDTNGDGGLDAAEVGAIGGRMKQFESDRHGVTAIKLGGDGDMTGSAVMWKESRNVPEVPAPLVYQSKVCLVMKRHLKLPRRSFRQSSLSWPHRVSWRILFVSNCRSSLAVRWAIPLPTRSCRNSGGAPMG
jgi:hypothetical protein